MPSDELSDHLSDEESDEREQSTQTAYFWQGTGAEMTKTEDADQDDTINSIEEKEAAKKLKPPKVSFYVSDDDLESTELREFEADVLNLIGDQDTGKESERSEFWRQLIRWNWLCWSKSPYVILDSRQYVYISADFTVFYWTQEQLRANIELDRVAFSIRMKEAMRGTYLRQYDHDSEGHGNKDDYLRSRWLINYFEVCSDGRTLSFVSDPSGATEKTPELKLGSEALPEGEHFEREMLIALRDYVQFKGENPESSETADRVGINILLPMRNLDLTVALDARIYDSRHRPDKLNLQLRNSDEVPFSQEASPLLKDFKSFSASPIGRDNFHLVKDSHDRLISRISELKQTAGHVRDAKRCLPDLPEASDCLGYRISWRWPHSPIEICISWTKPKRLVPNA